MSAANGSRPDRPERRLVADAVAARKRAQMVSGAARAGPPGRPRPGAPPAATAARTSRLRHLPDLDSRGSPAPAAPGGAEHRVRLRELLGAALGRSPSTGRRGRGSCGCPIWTCPTICGRRSRSRSGSRSSWYSTRHRRASSRSIRARRRDRERAALRGLEPDVRAQSGHGGARDRHRGTGRQPAREPPAYAIAPIDRCYELTGLIKAAGRGSRAATLSSRPWPRFFADLHEKAGTARRAPVRAPLSDDEWEPGSAMPRAWGTGNGAPR